MQRRQKKLRTKLEMLIKKIQDRIGLMTTIVLNTKISEVQNKIPDSSSLVTTTVLNTEISEFANKIPDHSKYTREFNKLIAELFATRLKQTNLVNKTDFYNKLTSFNKKITSNKTKYVETEKKLNSLTKRNYNFFSGRIYSTSNDGSFVYQPTLDTVEFKKR